MHLSRFSDFGNGVLFDRIYIQNYKKRRMLWVVLTFLQVIGKIWLKLEN